MITTNINIGLKELYTLKNFSFDIHNSGTADLNILSVTYSDNIKMSNVSTPFSIIKDTSYTVNGYIKIVNVNNSIGNDYIDYYVSYTDDEGDHTDTYRYYINYNGVLYNTYTQVIEISNMNYIDNMFIILIDSDQTIDCITSIILLSIDDVNLYLFPLIYKLDDKKLIYVFKDNTLKNKVINDKIKILISSEKNTLEISNIKIRSI